VPSEKPATAPVPVTTERELTDAEVRRLEAENIRAALRQAKGKVSGPEGAAALLGIKPTTLSSRIKVLDL
jgi:transcriptional regulator with GAF, ATPase, and Fis domain